MQMVPGESSGKEYLKLVGIIVAITMIAWWLGISYGASALNDWLRWFMGVFFVVFASFKFVGYSMFALMFSGYDIVAKRIKAYSYAYPFIELGLGGLYLFNLMPTARDILTVIVMSVGTIGVAQEVAKRSGVHCACLGNIIKLPLGTVSLIEDVSMGLMALAMLLSH
jgi:hypothetical protein